MFRAQKDLRQKRKSFLLSALVLVLLAVITIGLVSLHRQHTISKPTATVATGAKQAVTTSTPDDMAHLSYGPPPLPDETSSSHPCAGNSGMTCISAPSIDFYPGGSEGASNPAYKGSLGDGKEIMGRISAHNGTSLVLTAANGNAFSVEFPVDPIETFNTQRSQYYQGVTVGKGDVVYVWYTEAPGQSSTTIQASQLYSSSLILKETDAKANPDAAPIKY